MPSPLHGPVGPGWAGPLLWSVSAVAAGYLAGHATKRVFRSRVAAWAARTKGQWDDALIAELSARVPFWGLILGVYIASGHWTLTTHSTGLLDKVLFLALAISCTFFTASVVGAFVSDYGQRIAGDLPITSLLQALVRMTVIGIGVLTIMSGLGVSIAPILTALGVGGLAVALALQDTLANLFAGFYITIAGQIRVGNYVRLDSGEEGYLVDIAWRSARIRMLPNNIVLVPNAKLAQAIVTNYDLPEKEMAVLVNAGVDYASDLRHVERVTCDVARKVLQQTQGGVTTFEPFIRYHTFGESSVDFTVILRAREFVDQFLIKHEFVKALHERYAAEGITIPFPIRTIVSKDETSDGLRVLRR